MPLHTELGDYLLTILQICRAYGTQIAQPFNDFDFLSPPPATHANLRALPDKCETVSYFSKWLSINVLR